MWRQAGHIHHVPQVKEQCGPRLPATLHINALPKLRAGLPRQAVQLCSLPRLPIQRWERRSAHMQLALSRQRQGMIQAPLVWEAIPRDQHMLKLAGSSATAPAS
jgi:hypothetical protein